MERPILALTRVGEENGVSPASVSGYNMRLLVQLRWIAVGGQLLTILGVHFGLGVPLPLAPMLAVVAALALANHFARMVLYRRPIGQPAILLALVFDVAALTLQLSFSGGASNPFISLFLLQLVLGAILLEAGMVAVLMAVTATSYGLLGVYFLPLHYPEAIQPIAPLLEKFGAWVSFALTGGLLVVFITRVIRNLRARDVYLAELRQAAIEEDGLLRMGLLASGAAHELGTPLSSLSVVLNDWSRMPQIARDPELMADVNEMQIDIGRCKAIVSDMLHSAGTPRGEGAERGAAETLLRTVTTAWRETHPNVRLDVTLEAGLDQAMLVVEPALRQVLASLLDNAAEASPIEVAISAWREPDGLVVSITDRGPGFTEEQLAVVGKPYRSSKGAGRGLGLFLAATLARRLGGKLSAANRVDGGADVRLIVPLLSAPEPASARPLPETRP
jgi:two-component system sensor histidine kinase RegB